MLSGTLCTVCASVCVCVCVMVLLCSNNEQRQAIIS